MNRKKRADYQSARFLIEVPVYHIVIELDAVDGTELGDDRQNVCLLFGREFVFAMMDSVVGPITSSEIGVDTLASLSPVSIGYLIIEL